MNTFRGHALSWELTDGVVEVSLHRPAANEIGLVTLGELERLADALPLLERDAAALIIYSTLPSGFGAGADLRELYEKTHGMAKRERLRGVRNFLERIHRVFNGIDASALTTIVSTRTGRPFRYSTVTWDLPSGRIHGRRLFFRTSASRRVRRCASTMGMGISSGVSFVA